MLQVFRLLKSSKVSVQGRSLLDTDLLYYLAKAFFSFVQINPIHQKDKEWRTCLKYTHKSDTLCGKSETKLQKISNSVA